MRNLAPGSISAPGFVLLVSHDILRIGNGAGGKSVKFCTKRYKHEHLSRNRSQDMAETNL